MDPDPKHCPGYDPHGSESKLQALTPLPTNCRWQKSQRWRRWIRMFIICRWCFTGWFSTLVLQLNLQPPAHHKYTPAGQGDRGCRSLLNLQQNHNCQHRLDKKLYYFITLWSFVSEKYAWPTTNNFCSEVNTEYLILIRIIMVLLDPVPRKYRSRSESRNAVSAGTSMLGML